MLFQAAKLTQHSKERLIKQDFPSSFPDCQPEIKQEPFGMGQLLTQQSPAYGMAQEQQNSDCNPHSDHNISLPRSGFDLRLTCRVSSKLRLGS